MFRESLEICRSQIAKDKFYEWSWSIVKVLESEAKRQVRFHDAHVILHRKHGVSVIYTWKKAL